MANSITQNAAEKFSSTEIAQLCTIAEMAPEATAQLQPAHGPREFVAALAAAELHADAVRFLAHLLPKREAIFWAWSCARQVLPAEPPAPAAQAIEATGRWLAEPTEANRRPMLELAQQADLGTPAGCAALAVFLSGGSIAPPEVQAVEPDYYAAAKAIAGCITLAAVVSEPEKAPEKFGAFLTQGVDVGRRVGLWPADPPAA